MISLRFTSDTLPNDTFQVLQFDGEEQMSQLFRFELRLVSRDPNIDFKTVLEGQASLAITSQNETRCIHGMLSEFEQGRARDGGLYEYRAVLVPRLWMMTQSVQNQIYQEQTVPDILQSELNNIQSKGEHPLVSNGLSNEDYEIHTVGKYNEREYVVQYKETDFNFISRLMEHEGIYYYFDHDESAETLVISDGFAIQESDDQAPVHFQADAASTSHVKDIVYELNRAQKQIPGSVLLKDYNYQTPSLPLQATDVVSNDGIGFMSEYGSHFKTPEEGEKLATIRAEEFRCEQNIFSGESNVSRFCCGHVYTLTNHFRKESNQNYLMTKVIHHASQAIESWGNVGGASYYNEFSCIPANLQYRPQRLTPKPKLYGIMNGVIDSEQDMGRADLDEQGRYKVQMPFDISGAAPGRASRRIRMAQPYGGGGSGMSFPLVKGTEVIWTCIDGDIDRPIITGTVANPLNPSVTDMQNANTNVIKTSSGITMGFHDCSGEGTSQNATGGGAGGGLAAQQQFQNTDSSYQSWQQNQNQVSGTPEFTVSTIASDKAKPQPIAQQQQQMDIGVLDLSSSSIDEVAHNSGTGKHYTIGVPDYEGDASNRDCFFRLGQKSPVEVGFGEPWGLEGWLEYTDGNHVSLAHGDRISVTDGARTDIINSGEYSQEIRGQDSINFFETHLPLASFGGNNVARKISIDTSCSTEVAIGDKEEVFAGFSFDGSVGLGTEVKIGGSLSASLASSIEFNAAINTEYSKGFEISHGGLGSIDDEPDKETTGHLSNKLNIKAPIHAATSTAADVGMVAIGAIATGAVAASGVALAAGVGGVAYENGILSTETGVAAVNAVSTGAVVGVATALTAALTAKSIADYSAHKLAPALTELSLTPATIRLGFGDKPMALPGIDIAGPSPMIKIGMGASFIQITPDGIKLVAPMVDVVTTGKLGITAGGVLDLTAGAACNMKAVGNVGISTPTLDLSKCGLIP